MTLDLVILSWIWHQKQRPQKQKLTNGITSNLKSFIHQRTQSEWKDNQQNKRYVNHKGLISRVYKELLKFNNKSNNLIMQWAEELNRHFSEDDTQMTKKHMKRCSTLVVTGEMQIKTTMKYHLPPIRMSIIKKTENNKCWFGCKKL